MKILYRINADGIGQIQNDEHNTGAAMKHAAQRLGYVVTKFQMRIEGENIEVMALTPDTMTAKERVELEILIEGNHSKLRQIKRIKL